MPKNSHHMGKENRDHSQELTDIVDNIIVEADCHIPAEKIYAAIVNY